MAWTDDELDRIGDSDELQITTARGDGTLRRWVPIWVVRVGGELYVRSYRGTDGTWYRHAIRRGHGRIRACGLDREVTFAQPTASRRTAVNDAYRAKYARYGDAYLRPMLAPGANETTLRLEPRDPDTPNR
jgi:hypothetical protein